MTTDEVVTQPLVKKPKLDRLQCEYFMVKKNRRCGMTRRHDEKYCSEHLNLLKKQQGRQLHYNGSDSNDNNNNSNNKNNKKRRVPCPLDPNHTVWEYKLKSHVLKCTKGKNLRMNDGKAYYLKGLNSGKSNSGNTTNESTYKRYLKQTIDILRKIQKDIDDNNDHDDFVAATFPPIEFSFKQNDIMNSTRVRELDNLKHAVQQGSLIENIYCYIGDGTGSWLNQSLLDTYSTAAAVVVEFGCGRAEFSRYLNQQLLYRLIRDDDNNNKPTQPDPELNLTYVLIDRGTNRMKFDHKIRTDTAELTKMGKIGNETTTQNPKRVNLDIRRAKIDIRDLNIDFLLPEQNQLSCLAISKHLCGVATDLALRCIANSQSLRRQLSGICIAMCCRHACDPDDYINPQFVESILERYQGTVSSCDGSLDYDNFFRCLARICSWATSGRRAKTQGGDGEGDDTLVKVNLTADPNNNNDSNNNSNNNSTSNESSDETKGIQAMDIFERETLGLLARKIIDLGRLKWVQENLDGEAKLIHYVPQDVSLENVALMFRRKRD